MDILNTIGSNAGILNITALWKDILFGRSKDVVICTTSTWTTRIRDMILIHGVSVGSFDKDCLTCPAPRERDVIQFTIDGNSLVIMEIGYCQSTCGLSGDLIYIVTEDFNDPTLARFLRKCVAPLHSMGHTKVLFCKPG
jgi:hypothetical protein